MKRRHDSWSKRRRRGTTAVEMAFVSPVLFLLVFGLIEFARMAMVQHALTDAARAGCRTAALATTIDGGKAENAVFGHLDAMIAGTDKCRVTISPAHFHDMERGTEITTRVEVDSADVSWILPRYLGTVVLQGESTLKRE